MRLVLTLFFLYAEQAQDVGGRIRPEIVKSESLWVYQIIPVLDRRGVLYSFLYALDIPALKFWLFLHCTKI